MTTRKYSSRSQQTTLSGALTSTATTMTVQNGSNLMGGATVSSGETFTVVIDPDTALEEIVDVTAASTNTLTIVRGIETAGVGQAHSAGAVVRHMVTGRDLREANEHIENTTTAHGITLANLVKTTDTGTVTSTMIADGTIVNADISTTAAIAATKVSGTAVTQADTGTVTSTMIANGTIVDADVNSSAAIAKTKISGTAITAADTGTVNATILADLSVTTGKLVDTSVTTAKIADLNVTTGKVADSAITSAKIADGTIVDGDISATAAIAWTKIAPSSSVSSTELGYLDGVTANVQNQIDSKLATSTAASTYAPLASPALTGVPTAPTAAANTNTTQIATTAYVQTEINDLIASAPGALDTLNELAASLGNDANFSTTVTNSLATKLPLAGGTMTGAIAMGTNKITGLGTPTASTDAATKAYADAVIASAPSNLTGPITSVGAATSIASQTGTGTTFVMNTSPTIITPVITASSTTDALRITNTGTGYSLLVEDSANPDTTPFIIDHLGRLILGNDGYPTAGSGSFLGSIVGTGSAYPFALYGMYASSAGSRIALHKSRSTAIGTYTTINSGDTLGDLVFYGDDGTAWQNSATIRANADATPSGGVIPGRLVFLTTDSAGTSTERMRIDSAGQVGIGATASTGTTLRIGKNLTGAVISYGIYNNNAVQSDVTTSAQLFSTFPSVVDTAFTLGSLVHFQASQGTKGASATITNQYGYLAQSTLTGATNNYGFYGNLAAASGVWNTYMNGTAANYFAGRVGIGATLTSGAMAQITNTTAADVGLVVKGATSQTGDLTQWQNSAGTVLSYVSASGIFYPAGMQLQRQDSSSEGGQLNLARASDNALAWYVDVYGSTSTPSFRIVDNTASSARLTIDGSGYTTIGLIADGTTSTAATGGGFMGMPQNSTTTGSYTIVAGDAGKHIYSTATRTVTIPANGSVAFPVGTVLSFISGAGATTTIAITTDTMYLAGTGTTGSRTLAAHGMATAVKVASTTWYISGNGLT